jgi:hypothetical protein
MEQRPGLFIFRHRNKQRTRNFMNNLDWQPNDNNSDLSNQDKYSLEQLRAMQLVAKMKEAADRAGAGFVGGFVTPTGQRFMMSNVDETDAQFKAIQDQLSSIQNKNSQNNSEESFFDKFQNSIQLIETPEGIEIRVKPEEE